MGKITITLTILLLLAFQAAAGSDTTRNSSWWLAYKIGAAESSVPEFQTWAASQGVTGVSSISRNPTFGFDLLYNRNRMVYGLSSDFELRTFGRTEPYFFTFSLRAGYQLAEVGRLQLRTLGGIGASYAFVRFENQIPASLQNISANYDDPYARASAFVGRFELLASLNLYGNPDRKLLQFRPLLFVNAGVQPVFQHGRWSYGDSEPDSFDGTRFVAQRIDMPRFYRGSWFISVGFALAITHRQ
jgi:hypothetical protein